jgi:hypothetical protein
MQSIKITLSNTLEKEALKLAYNLIFLTVCPSYKSDELVNISAAIEIYL